MGLFKLDKSSTISICKWVNQLKFTVCRWKLKVDIHGCVSSGDLSRQFKIKSSNNATFKKIKISRIFLLFGQVLESFRVSKVKVLKRRRFKRTRISTNCWCHLHISSSWRILFWIFWNKIGGRRRVAPLRWGGYRWRRHQETQWRLAAIHQWDKKEEKLMSPTLDPRRGRHLWNFIIWLQPAENSPLGGTR